MDMQKLVLSRISQHKPLNPDEDLVRAICFMVDNIGYEDTKNMPISLFNAMIKFYEWKAEEEKKAMKK